MFTLGLTMWIVVVALGMEHTPITESLGTLHAAMAGMVAGSAFLPRTMMRWP